MTETISRKDYKVSLTVWLVNDLLPWVSRTSPKFTSNGTVATIKTYMSGGMGLDVTIKNHTRFTLAVMSSGQVELRIYNHSGSGFGRKIDSGILSEAAEVYPQGLDDLVKKEIKDILTKYLTREIY